MDNPNNPKKKNSSDYHNCLTPKKAKKIHEELLSFTKESINKKSLYCNKFIPTEKVQNAKNDENKYCNIIVEENLDENNTDKDESDIDSSDMSSCEEELVI